MFGPPSPPSRPLDKVSHAYRRLIISHGSIAISIRAAACQTAMAAVALKPGLYASRQIHVGSILTRCLVRVLKGKSLLKRATTGSQGHARLAKTKLPSCTVKAGEDHLLSCPEAKVMFSSMKAGIRECSANQDQQTGQQRNACTTETAVQGS